MRTRIGLLLAAVMVAAPAFTATVPRPAPDLVIDMPDGSKLPLAKFKGKVIAVEFLLTGCSHCQQAARTISKMVKEYGPKGFQPVGGAINQDAALQLKGFIQQNGVNYPIGFVSQEKAHDFLQHSVMLSMPMPQLVFIDRKGTIRAQYGGTSPFFADEERNMRNTIEELLKEPAGGTAAPKKGKK